MLIKTTYFLTIEIIISGTDNCRSIIEARHGFNLVSSPRLVWDLRNEETATRGFTESWKSTYDNFFFQLPPSSLPHIRENFASMIVTYSYMQVMAIQV